MNFGQELQDWLADRARQQRTQRAIDGLGLDWNQGALQRRFDASVAGLATRSAEAAAEVARSLFAEHDWIDGLIATLAAPMRADPFFEPPFRVIGSDMQSGLILFESEAMSIAAGVTRVMELAARKNAKRGPTSIGFSGRVSVLKFVRAGDALVSFWEAPPITAAFTAATAGQCRRTGERRLADGDILTVDGRHQGYVIERARANLLILQAEINLDRAPLSVEYDSATLSYAGCSATGDSASRIQMLATLLRKLGAESAFPALAGFLDHPDFFVRWHVMRELLGIDAEAALPQLKRMAAHDPHDDVRRAARAVLDRLQAPRQRKAA